MGYYEGTRRAARASLLESMCLHAPTLTHIGITNTALSASGNL